MNSQFYDVSNFIFNFLMWIFFVYEDSVPFSFCLHESSVAYYRKKCIRRISVYFKLFVKYGSESIEHRRFRTPPFPPVLKIRRLVYLNNRWFYEVTVMRLGSDSNYLRRIRRKCVCHTGRQVARRVASVHYGEGYCQCLSGPIFQLDSLSGGELWFEPK